MNPIISGIRNSIFSSKWLLVPFYIGLIITQLLYLIKFSVALFEMFSHFLFFSENQMILAVLGLIDMVMIGNLLKIIVAGSYYSLVEKVGGMSEKITSGYLKVKMSMSLVGISSIHLLSSFINSAGMTNRQLIIQISIHCIFLVGTVMLAFVEYLHERSKETYHTCEEDLPRGDSKKRDSPIRKE